MSGRNIAIFIIVVVLGLSGFYFLAIRGSDHQQQSGYFYDNRSRFDDSIDLAEANEIREAGCQELELERSLANTDDVIVCYTDEGELDMLVINDPENRLNFAYIPAYYNAPDVIEIGETGETAYCQSNLEDQWFLCVIE